MASFLASTPKAGSEPETVPAEQLFVTSPEQGTITRIDLDTGSSNIIVTGLETVEGITCSPDGGLYATQSGLTRQIVRMNLDGSGLAVILKFSSTPELVSSGGPQGPSLGPNGELFFNTDGTEDPGLPHTGVWKLPAGGGSPAQVILPFAGSSGNGGQTLAIKPGYSAAHLLLAVDSSNDRVIRRAAPSPFDTAVDAADFITEPYLEKPNGLAVNGKGDVFVSEESSGRIKLFADDGTYVNYVDLYEPGRSLGGIAFDSRDNLYVPTRIGAGSSPVIRISPDGTQTTVGTVPGGSGIVVCKSLVDTSVFTLQPGENVVVNVGQYVPTLNMTITLNVTVALQLRISQLASTPVDTPAQVSALGVFFEITANETVALDARIRTFYPESQLAGGDENRTAPYTYDPSVGTWVLLENIARDTAANWVEGTVHHFSLFGIFSEILSRATPALAECSYCNWWLWASAGGAGVIGTGTAYRMVRRHNGRLLAASETGLQAKE